MRGAGGGSCGGRSGRSPIGSPPGSVTCTTASTRPCRYATVAVAPCGMTNGAYWAPGILATFGLIMLNIISWEGLTEDGLTGDEGMACKLKVWVTVSFVILFCSLGGALWILIANGWMQNPVGAEFNPITMRMELTSFFEVMFNSVAQAKFVHTVCGDRNRQNSERFLGTVLETLEQIFVFLVCYEPVHINLNTAPH